MLGRIAAQRQRTLHHRRRFLTKHQKPAVFCELSCTNCVRLAVAFHEMRRLTPSAQSLRICNTASPGRSTRTLLDGCLLQGQSTVRIPPRKQSAWCRETYPIGREKPEARPKPRPAAILHLKARQQHVGGRDERKSHHFTGLTGSDKCNWKGGCRSAQAREGSPAPAASGRRVGCSVWCPELVGDAILP